MSYKVTILGKSYELPTRTIDIDEQMENINEKCIERDKGQIKRTEFVPYLYNFVTYIVPECLPPIEEIDTNDLEKAAIDILMAYDEPNRKIRNDAQMADVKDLMSRPEVQKLLKMTGTVRK